MLFSFLLCVKLEEIVPKMMSEDVREQLEGTSALRKLITVGKRCSPLIHLDSFPIQEVIDAGLVPRLVQFLTVSYSSELQVHFT